MPHTRRTTHTALTLSLAALLTACGTTTPAPTPTATSTHPGHTPPVTSIAQPTTSPTTQQHPTTSASGSSTPATSEKPSDSFPALTVGAHPSQPDQPAQRNDHGTYTVRCEVFRAQQLVGYTVGNNSYEQAAAVKDAAHQVRAFRAKGARTQHCEIIDMFIPTGAYSLTMEPVSSVAPTTDSTTPQPAGNEPTPEAR